MDTAITFSMDCLNVNLYCPPGTWAPVEQRVHLFLTLQQHQQWTFSELRFIFISKRFFSRGIIFTPLQSLPAVTVQTYCYFYFSPVRNQKASYLIWTRLSLFGKPSGITRQYIFGKEHPSLHTTTACILWWADWVPPRVLQQPIPEQRQVSRWAVDVNDSWHGSSQC